MAHFELWERKTLNQFAAEATRKLMENEAEIERLRDALMWIAAQKTGGMIQRKAVEALQETVPNA